MDNLSTGVAKVLERQRMAVHDLVETLEEQLQQVVTPELIQRTGKICAVGCGDSYFAARGARLFFDQLGLAYEPLESMEFSRYGVETLPRDTLVVGVSYGGKVSRTQEALLRARARGIATLAASGYADRPVAQAAEKRIIGSLPGIRQVIDQLDAGLEAKKLSPEKIFEELAQPGAAQKIAGLLGIEGGLQLALVGMGAFISSILPLYLLAIHVARLRGLLESDRAQALREQILTFNDIQAETLLKGIDPARQLADHFRDQPYFLFLGSGPSYASALFSAAKLFEQPHMVGIGQYVEEWAHLHIFTTRPGIGPLFFIVPPGPSRGRVIEQMHGAKQLGATTVVVCDEFDEELVALADHALPIYGQIPEEFSPLVYTLPGQLFSFAMLEQRGQTPLDPSISFQRMMEINYNQIYASRLLEE